MSLIQKALYCFILCCFICTGTAHALNPLFDTKKYPATATSKKKKVRARFFFRRAHSDDTLAIKTLYLKGLKTEAMKMLTRAKDDYETASDLDPANPMIKIFAKAHDSVNEDGLLVRGDKNAKLALSAFYDGEENETPEDPTLRAFWLGKGLKTDDEKASRSGHRSHHSHHDKKGKTKEGSKDTAIDKRMTAAMGLGSAAGLAGIEIGKSLTTTVALQYLTGGAGFLLGLGTYICGFKAIVRYSNNHVKAQEKKDTEALLARLEDLIDQKSYAAAPKAKSAGIPCPTCSCPTCSCPSFSWSCVFCCLPCCRKKRAMMWDDDLYDDMELGQSALYTDRYEARANPLYADDASESEEPRTDRRSLSFLTRESRRLAEKRDNGQLDELSKAYRERLIKFGPNDPFVKKFCDKMKQFRHEASVLQIMKYTPPNSANNSELTERSSASYDDPDHIDFNIPANTDDMDSIETSYSVSADEDMN